MPANLLPPAAVPALADLAQKRMLTFLVILPVYQGSERVCPVCLNEKPLFLVS